LSPPFDSLVSVVSAFGAGLQHAPLNAALIDVSTVARRNIVVEGNDGGGGGNDESDDEAREGGGGGVDDNNCNADGGDDGDDDDDDDDDAAALGDDLATSLRMGEVDIDGAPLAAAAAEPNPFD
jgi:hypothetical protein